jgi:hypothetical protein
MKIDLKKFNPSPQGLEYYKKGIEILKKEEAL